MQKSFVVVAISFLAVPTASQAAVLYTSPGTVSELTVPGQTQTPNFDSAGGAGQVSFNLLGFKTLDGADNGQFTDIFTLSLNGTAIYSGSFGLGGFGNNQVFFAPTGYTTSVTSGGYGQGGSAQISMPVLLAAGNNYLTFAYDTASPQGIGDEGWAVSDIRVEGTAAGVAAVPESATWAMMIAGFGLVGGALRRRQQVAVSFA